MGGPGSGRPIKIQRTYTDELPQIDIRKFKKTKVLVVLQQSPTEKVIFYEDGEPAKLKLSISEEHATTSVTTICTPCHYGGQQRWLVCPRCFKRVAILYFRDSSLACRTCLKLKYRSQYKRSPTCLVNMLIRPFFSRATINKLLSKYG